MTKKQHYGHLASVVLFGAAALALDALRPDGPLGHYQWAAPIAAVVAWGARALGAAPPPPPAAFIGMLVASAVMLNGCWLFKGPVGPTPPADGGTFVDCSDATIHKAILDLVPDIESALALNPVDSAAALDAKLKTVAEDLAKAGVADAESVAIAEMGCAINYVLGLAAEQAAPPTSDSLEATKAANAKAWFARHPITVKAGA